MFVHPSSEMWCQLMKRRAALIKEDKVIEGHERTTPVFRAGAVRPDSDPCDETVDAVGRRLRTDAPNSDDRVEFPGTNAAHAAMDAKPA
jgi:hypothetical protein